MGVIWRSLTSAISSLTRLITTLVFQAPNLLNCVCQGQLGAQINFKGIRLFGVH